jgi:hypothetical protein
MLIITCPTCGQKIKIPDSFTFSRGRCPKCKEMILNPRGSVAQGNLMQNLNAMRSLSFFRWFEVRYDEISVYIIAAALLILILVHLGPIIRWFREGVSSSTIGEIIWYGFCGSIILLCFGTGWFLSLYHVFTNRKKNPDEGGLMAIFAISVNAVTGFLVARYMFFSGMWVNKWWLGIIPVWLFLNSIFLFLKLQFHQYNDDVISDENASIVQVFVSTIILVAVFAICHFILDMYWAVTYSICVIYATGFAKAVRSLVGNH